MTLNETLGWTNMLVVMIFQKTKYHFRMNSY